jgi:hypothetical protein
LTAIANAYTSNFRVNASTLEKLRSLPNHVWNPVWPQGKRQPLTKQLAARFFSLISTNDKSLMALLTEHPELPPFSQLNIWRAQHAWFAEAWRNANKQRAHFLAETCADLQHQADPKTAHVVRVRFDVIKWLCARLHPEHYGDKPQPAQNSTTVNVGVSITPERLTDLRAKLDSTRSQLQPKPSRNGKKTELSALAMSTDPLGCRSHSESKPEPAP